MGKFPIEGPYTYDIPQMASADGLRVGAGKLDAVTLWLHRPTAQRVTVAAELLAGVPVRSGVVAVLDAPGSSTVTAIEGAVGMLHALVDDVPIEVGVVAIVEKTVA